MCFAASLLRYYAMARLIRMNQNFIELIKLTEYMGKNFNVILLVILVV